MEEDDDQKKENDIIGIGRILPNHSFWSYVFEGPSARYVFYQKPSATI